MQTNPGFDERKSIFFLHIRQRNNVISLKKQVSEGMIYSAQIECQDDKSAWRRAPEIHGEHLSQRGRNRPSSKRRPEINVHCDPVGIAPSQLLSGKCAM